MRACFDEARSSGPRAMALLMASITKKGRRFRAPRVLPPLTGENGCVITNKKEILETLGDFFAKAEKAQKVTREEYQAQARVTKQPQHDAWRAADVAHVGMLATAFRRLKNGKAPGASGLPPETFSQASHHAAMTIFPLFLKGMCRHEFASGLLGAQVAVIPTPNKSPHHPTTWRNVWPRQFLRCSVVSLFRPSQDKPTRLSLEEDRKGRLAILPI